MAKYIPNFSGSLTLRTTQSAWFPNPIPGSQITVTNPSALTYAQMDFNWWNLYSWSFQIDEAVEGAAFTGSANNFTSPNTFSGPVVVNSPFAVNGPTTLTGNTSFIGGNSTFSNGFSVIGGQGQGQFNGGFTGSLNGTADTASYVDITGDGITVTNFGSQIQLTASLGNTFSASIAGRVTTLETDVTNLSNQFALSSSRYDNLSASFLTTSASYVNASASFSASIATIATTYATKVELLDTQSALLQGITASANEVRAGVTASLLSYTLTSSFDTYTASFDTAVSTSIATAVTGAFVELTASLISAINYSGSILSDRLDVISSSYVINSISSSFLGTSSYVPLVAGPGLTVNGMEITASLRTVNGVSPVNGNAQVTLASVQTGTSASLVATSANTLPTGSVWVISGDANPNVNGDTYIVGLGATPGPNEWYPIAPLDQPAGDARYLMLTPQAPLSGALNLGGFQINSLSNPSLLTDAVNLQTVLAQTASLSVGVTASINAISTSISNYTTLISQSVAPQIQDLYTGSKLLQDSASYLYSALATSGSQYNVNSASFSASISNISNSLPTYLSSSLTASFVTTASYNTDSSSWNSILTTSASNYAINSASWNTEILDLNNWTGSGASTFAGTASYVNVVGQDITVNWNGAILQLTGSNVAGFVTTSSFNAFTASTNTTLATITSSFATYTASINSWTSSAYTGSVDQFTLTSSFNTFTGSLDYFTASYNVDSASASARTTTLEATASTAYISSSITSNVITFNKGNGTVETITLPASSVVDVSTYLSSSWTGSVYQVNSASFSASIATIETTYATKIELNTSSSDLKAGVTASLLGYIQNNWTSSVFGTYTASYDTAVSGTYATKAEVQTTQSAILSGVTASANEVKAGVTASLLNYVQNTWTASYNTGSWLGNVNGTSSWAQNVTLLGDGITVNGMELTASVKSVNGIFPTNGNIPIALTSTITGTSASLATSASNGTVTTGSIWIISGDPTPALNGDAYILVSESFGNVPATTWTPVGGFDIAQGDARYLKLDASNDPMTGELAMGANKITGLAEGTLSNDAINLGQLTSSFNNLQAGVTASLTGYVQNSWTGSNTSVFAGTASFVDVTGSGVLVNWNGSTLQLTASAGGTTPNLQSVTTVGNVTTGSIGIGGAVNASAILTLTSTTQGVLFPRMTNAQRTAIGTPATGLIVYCTDAPEGLFINKSSGWVQII